MAPFTVPDDGLALSGLPSSSNSAKKARIAQAVQIKLPSSASIADIVRLCQSNEPRVHVVLGKSPVLLLDDRRVSLDLNLQENGYLYKRSDDTELALVARLDLRIPEARKESDNAMLTLEASMAGLKQQKQANTTVLVNGIIPTGKNSSKGKTSNSLKAHRVGLFSRQELSRASSQISSPALNAKRAPQPNAARSSRQAAIQTALLHLLAIRPLTQKYVVNKINCSPSDVEAILSKFAEPYTLDHSKYDLRKESYRRVDVWDFPYDDDDRQTVIDRAITAFDRLRFGKEESIWQSLLPQHERGKGKCLSRLNLGAPGRPTIQRSHTPDIHIHKAGGESRPTEGGSISRKRPAPDAVRSNSQEPAKKVKTSDGISQSQSSAEKVITGSQSTEDSSVMARKGQATKSFPGRAGAKKSAAPDSSRFKSDEFINDSDAEDDVEGAVNDNTVEEDRRELEIVENSKSKATLAVDAKLKERKQSPARRLEKLAPSTSSTLLLKSSAPPSPTQAQIPREQAKPVSPALQLNPERSKTSNIRSNGSLTPDMLAKPRQKLQIKRKMMPVDATSSPAMRASSGNKPLSSSQSNVSRDSKKPSATSRPPTVTPSRHGDAAQSVSKEPRVDKTAQAVLRAQQVTKKSPAASTAQPARDLSSVPMAKSISRNRKTSSPIKPSPLASSPPISASDADDPVGGNSSSSATPLAEKRRQQFATKGVARPINRSGTPARPRGDSDVSLKRKANDVDSNIHSHGSGPADTEGRPAKRPALDKGTNTPSHSRPATPAADKPRIKEAKDNSDSHTAQSTPTSDEGKLYSGTIMGFKYTELEEVSKWQEALVRYNVELRKVTLMDEPPSDRVRELNNTYKRLDMLKQRFEAHPTLQQVDAVI